MKVKDIIDILNNCNPEDEAFIYGYDRGNTAEIEDVRVVTEDTSPYDRNGFVNKYIEKHGHAVLICDYKW